MSEYEYRLEHPSTYTLTLRQQSGPDGSLSLDVWTHEYVSVTEEDIDRAVRAFCAELDRITPVEAGKQRPATAYRIDTFYP